MSPGRSTSAARSMSPLVVLPGAMGRGGGAAVTGASATTNSARTRIETRMGMGCSVSRGIPLVSEWEPDYRGAHACQEVDVCRERLTTLCVVGSACLSKGPLRYSRHSIIRLGQITYDSKEQTMRSVRLFLCLLCCSATFAWVPAAHAQDSEFNLRAAIREGACDDRGDRIAALRNPDLPSGD